MAARQSSFTANDPVGWDECAPSIDACTVDGRAIPDHGDLWTARWAVTASRDDLLDMTATGTSLNYRIRRSIRATAAGFHFEYSACALRGAIPFMWTAHPLFASPPGTHIELSPAPQSVIDVLDPGGVSVPWSRELSTLDALPPLGIRKVYVEPEQTVVAATIRHTDGSSLTMTWQDCPYLGLWFDNGLYSSQPVVALEPSLAFRDSLSLAIQLGRAPILTTDHELRWALDIAFAPTT
jgi:galactose mutarotase-like enzyme